MPEKPTPRRLTNKRKYQHWFKQWLYLMDAAYDYLTLHEYNKLEDRILKEIIKGRRTGR